MPGEEYIAEIFDSVMVLRQIADEPDAPSNGLAGVKLMLFIVVCIGAAIILGK